MATGKYTGKLPSAAEIDVSMADTSKTPAKKAAKATTPAPTTQVVQLSQEQFAELLAAATQGKARKAPKAKAAKAARAEQRKANRAEARAVRREAAKARGASALEACVAASGKSPDEVRAAFKAAHAAAAPANAQGVDAYKAAYNAALVQLIGCARYAA